MSFRTGSGISGAIRQGSFPEGWRGMIQGTQAAFKLIADRTTLIKPRR
jgi:hypothetical protein